MAFELGSAYASVSTVPNFHETSKECDEIMLGTQDLADQQGATEENTGFLDLTSTFANVCTVSSPQCDGSVQNTEVTEETEDDSTIGIDIYGYDEEHRPTSTPDISADEALKEEGGDIPKMRRRMSAPSQGTTKWKISSCARPLGNEETRPDLLAPEQTKEPLRLEASVENRIKKFTRRMSAPTSPYLEEDSLPPSKISKEPVRLEASIENRIEKIKRRMSEASNGQDQPENSTGSTKEPLRLEASMKNRIKKFTELNNSPVQFAGDNDVYRKQKDPIRLEASMKSRISNYKRRMSESGETQFSEIPVKEPIRLEAAMKTRVGRMERRMTIQ